MLPKFNVQDVKNYVPPAPFNRYKRITLDSIETAHPFIARMLDNLTKTNSKDGFNYCDDRIVNQENVLKELHRFLNANGIRCTLKETEVNTSDSDAPWISYSINLPWSRKTLVAKINTLIDTYNAANAQQQAVAAPKPMSFSFLSPAKQRENRYLKKQQQQPTTPSNSNANLAGPSTNMGFRTLENNVSPIPLLKEQQAAVTPARKKPNRYLNQQLSESATDTRASFAVEPEQIDKSDNTFTFSEQDFPTLARSQSPTQLLNEQLARRGLFMPIMQPEILANTEVEISEANRAKLVQLRDLHAKFIKEKNALLTSLSDMLDSTNNPAVTQALGDMSENPAEALEALNKLLGLELKDDNDQVNSNNSRSNKKI